MPIRQQNFMIENKKFFVYSVGATIGRPLDSPEFQAGELKETPTENNHRIGVN